jgi:hypothetical protein
VRRWRLGSVLRRECLSKHYFIDEDDAQRILDRWRADYNNFRPHGSLARSTPVDFAAGTLSTPGPKNSKNSHFPLSQTWGAVGMPPFSVPGSMRV